MTVRGWNSASSTVQLGDLLPVVILGVDPEDRRRPARRASAPARRASWSAVIALSSVKSGPPNAPACWPVTTATVSGSASRAAAARAAGGRVAPRLLRGEHGRDARSRSRGCCLRAGADLAPRLGRLRVARVERGDAGEVEGVVAGERPDPREPAHVDRQTPCRGAPSAVVDDASADTESVLSQSLLKHVKVSRAHRDFDARIRCGSRPRGQRSARCDGGARRSTE